MIKKLFSLLFKLLLALITLGVVIVISFVVLSHTEVYSNKIPQVNNFNDLKLMLYTIGNTTNIPLISGKLAEIKIDQKVIELDAEFYPYFHSLSDDEKLLYSQIYENVEQGNSSFFLCKAGFKKEEVEKVWESVFYDHPELFWLSESFYLSSLGDSDDILAVFMDFYKFDDLEKAKNDFNHRVNSILESTKSTKTEQGKEILIHDKLSGLVEYTGGADYGQSAYSAMVNGKAVCAGYAKAYQYLMTLSGIPCYYTPGWSEGDHAWNIVRVEDEYYNVDLTWDDSLGTHAFFNRSDKDFGGTHRRDEIATILPECNGVKYRNEDAIPAIIIGG